MKPRERLLTVLNGGIPDCVPVAPDISNMIPAKMTGLPFWDLYLYKKIPIWEAYIRAAKYFDFDSVMDGYFPLRFPYESEVLLEQENFIVFRDKDRIVTQKACRENGRLQWADSVSVYYRADPPTARVRPEQLGLPPVPPRYEPVEGVRQVDTGPAGLKRVKELLGDQGLVGVFLTGTVAFSTEEGVYRYYDNPELHEQWAEERIQAMERRFDAIMAMEVKPDFICVGGSGTLVTQTEEMLRKVSLPAVKRAIELCHAAGMPTHVHSCGPEKRLVEIMAEETALTVIDPLEVAPMGDCSLADLKRRFGKKIVLKGNLHTTQVMLHGSVKDVVEASKKAIDDAAAGGGFILSTGDQCGRDTPFENLLAMIDTAREYGRY